MGTDLANPLGGINTDFQFKPGGNPYSALATNGLAGLGEAYGQSYNSALAANQQNYNNVIGGYKNLASGVANILGQGGSWGVATPGAQAIEDTRAQATGGAIQNSINKGLGGSTAAVAAQRGANLDSQKAYASLAAQLAQTYAGYTSGIGQGMLGAMQSTQIPFPNAAEYSGLYQQYGQQQASAQNMALLAQQSQAQQEMARRVFSANQGRGGGGGGGVSIPQMPRGGTFGSGGGGFASGGGMTPTGFGLPTFGSGGSVGAGGGGFLAPSSPAAQIGFGGVQGAAAGAAAAAGQDYGDPFQGFDANGYGPGYGGVDFGGASGFGGGFDF